MSDSKEAPGTPFQPLWDKVLVKPDPVQEKTATGLYLPEQSQERMARGTIVSTGPGYRLEGGVQPLVVKEGDRVVFGKYGGIEIDLEGESHVVISERDIHGILHHE